MCFDLLMKYFGILGKKYLEKENTISNSEQLGNCRLSIKIQQRKRGELIGFTV